MQNLWYARPWFLKMKRVFLLLVFAACASAGSIWEYTFTDTFCTSCQTLSFMFVEGAPISISPGATFLLDGSDLSSCRTLNPDVQCQQINMYRRSDGQLQVNLFLRSSTYPNDWEPPIEAHFAVPALNLEGIWTNSFRVDP